MAPRLVFCLCLYLTLALAASAEKLKVGVAGPSPYVTNEGSLDGLSVRVWRDIAEGQRWDFEFVEFSGLAELEQAVVEGKVQVAVGPLPIDATIAKRVDLSQPYYTSHIAMVSIGERRKPLEVLGDLVSSQGWRLALVLMGIMLVVSWVVWRFERVKNAAQFPPNWDGFFNSVWFALVTMTTVGYGDHHPITRGGRIVTAIWMLTATAMFSALVAILATKLTLAETDLAVIDNLTDLEDRRVAVVAGSDGQEMARHVETRAVVYQSVQEAFAALRLGAVEAILADEVEMEYEMAKRRDETYLLVQLAGHEELFGFAVPRESKLRRDLDIGIMDLRESGRLRLLRDNWLAATATAHAGHEEF